jgi:ABC-type uncharacterized transport system permease subunit
MSATMRLPAHSWASAHRVLLTVMAIALALAVALTIVFVVSRTTGGETVAPGGGNPNPSQPRFPTERCMGNICAK